MHIGGLILILNGKRKSIIYSYFMFLLVVKSNEIILLSGIERIYTVFSMEFMFWTSKIYFFWNIQFSTDFKKKLSVKRKLILAKKTSECFKTSYVMWADWPIWVNQFHSISSSSAVIDSARMNSHAECVSGLGFTGPLVIHLLMWIEDTITLSFQSRKEVVALEDFDLPFEECFFLACT